MERQFKKTISSSEINQSVIDDFYSGAVSMYIVTDSDKETVHRFGKLLDQDMYGRKIVTIGIEDAQGEKLDHSRDMLWHQDRAYSKTVHPFVGLYCIRADEGSSPTHFIDMQTVYDNSSEQLKEKSENLKCLNTITKYMSQEKYPYKFKTPVQERAWRMKNRAEHPLVWQDSTGKFYFFSEAYTETDLEEEFKQEISKTESYVHEWKPNELLVYNNHKVIHKRDSTPNTVIRQHIRYAIDKA